MNFKNFEELVRNINIELGTFCRIFQYERKRLLNMGRVGKANILFKFDKSNERNWAINAGGGTEIQYHIYFDVAKSRVDYGIGFNSQYVQFKNAMPSVDYIRPYIESFLQQPTLRKQLEAEGFKIIRGNESLLHTPQNNEYVLFGKRLNVSMEADEYSLEDTDCTKMITEIKGVMFDTYKSVIENISHKTIADTILNKKIDILRYKNQIILQGPPGTGKTYNAKKIAEKIIFEKISEEEEKVKRLKEQFKIIQFHPSYTYEDFVRGITVRNEGNKIEYFTENKVLAEFAEKALTNYQNSNKKPQELAQESAPLQLIKQYAEYIDNLLDEDKSEFPISKSVDIIRVHEDAFRYTGKNWKNEFRMKFKDLVIAYNANVQNRQDIKKISELSTLAKEHATYYYHIIEDFRNFLKRENPDNPEIETETLKNYILIIDEINRANLPSVLGELIYALEYRGEAVESMYAIDGDDRKITLPPNLYIIGTMNTADRSVGHIDYAVRRRFAFIDMLPQKDIIEDEKAKVLFEEVESLFDNHLTADFSKNDVQLGHSYFLTNNEQELAMSLEYEIKPILFEYLKDGIFTEKAKEVIENLTV